MTTGFNTSSGFNIPCAEVLSVAGLYALPALFPLGETVIPEAKSLLITLGFSTFINFILPFPLTGGLSLLVQ